MKKKVFGFGFNPAESKNHFYVISSGDNRDAMISVYERFSFDDGEQIIHPKDILKIEIPRYKWERLSCDVEREFNKRLKSDGLPSGKFGMKETVINRLMGKELMVLLWAIESNDVSCIPTALSNWHGLLPEERWWLYTMTNASTGNIADKSRGWRQALRFALCDNPVGERLCYS